MCSLAGQALIKSFEGLRLEAYLDQAGIPTIGFGTIRYPNGEKVKLGDRCTEVQASDYFAHDLQRFELDVDALTTDLAHQRQFDALVSFTYNLGTGNYRASHLRLTVNLDPDNPVIRHEFMKWYYAGGHPNKGLWHRRHLEANAYFNQDLPEPPFPG